MPQQLRVNRLLDATGARILGIGGDAGDYPGQKIIYVDTDNGADTYDGTNPDYPKLTMTGAISAATNASTGPGDWIFVLKYADYAAPTTETFPISIDKYRLTISGMPTSHGAIGNGQGICSDETDVATLSIANNWITVQYLMLDCAPGGLAAGGVVQGPASGARYGFTLRNCYVGGYTSQYGFYTGAATDFPNLLIEDCTFGPPNSSAATSYIYLYNATRGVIRNNLFRNASSYAIHVPGTCGNCMFLDNRFKLSADTDGFAIYVASGSGINNYFDGNRAAHGMAAMTNDPFWDLSADGNNCWGLNYKDKTAILPSAA